MQKFLNFSQKTGLTLLVPIIKITMNDEPKKQVAELVKITFLPLLALSIFFGLWGLASKNIRTSVGALPSPAYVGSQAVALLADARTEKINKKEFVRHEQARAELSSLLSERRTLEAAKATPEQLSALDQKRATWAATWSAYNLTLDAQIATLTAEVAAATSKAEKRGIKDRRIAPYATGLLKICGSSREFLTGLISKNEKISEMIAEQAAVDEKKAAVLDKKRTAIETQLTKAVEYSGKGSIFDYISRSIITVIFGFFLAATVAIPLGILCGLSKNFMTAVNPLIQTFRPVSPLAWVLITIQIVDGIFVGDKALTGELVNNPFLHSAITVALCSMWATLSNTALGVSSVSPDYMNVAKVLKLSWFDRVAKIILPSAVPYIFTGLRITLGVGWMVLIVSEMMATSRGLGWYIDQQYQNNKVESLANIIVCIFIIGIIGAILDRIMFILHRAVSFNQDEVSA